MPSVTHTPLEPQSESARHGAVQYPPGKPRALPMQSPLPHSASLAHARPGTGPVGADAHAPDAQV